MERRIQEALDEDRVIDMTTIGRMSGAPHRVEIWFFRAHGKFYITGAPGRRRDWYLNLVAHPEFIFHLKQNQQMDLDATALPILESALRTKILRALLAQMKPGIPAEWMPSLNEAARAATDRNFAVIAADPEAVLPQWLDESPLVEVRIHSERAGEKDG